MRAWLDGLVQGIRRKLDEWREALDGALLPDRALVPVPIRKPPRARRR